MHPKACKTFKVIPKVAPKLLKVKKLLSAKFQKVPKVTCESLNASENVASTSSDPRTQKFSKVTFGQVAKRCQKF